MKAWLLTMVGVGVVLAVLGVALVHVALIDYRAASYTANVGEVVKGVVVGQTFVANKDKLSEVAVMFATYSGRENKQVVKFSLRELDRPLEIIREARVNASGFGDNQLYRFSFDQIDDSKGKVYVFLIESPLSVPGDAVTVDIDARDPYHFGSAYIMRGIVNEARLREKLPTSGKASLDVAFSTYYQVPLWKAGLIKGSEAIQYFKDSWQEKRSLYGIWARSAMQAFLLLGISWMVTLSLSDKDAVGRGAKKKILQWLILLVVLGIIVRLIYAVELPFTNDEGNYLYDARTLLGGELAGGDGYVKAPLVVLWIAFWQMIGGQTLWAGRFASVFISALTVWPIYVIAREFWGRKAGVCAATVWSLLGVTTVFGIYVHTQPLAIFWGVSGIAILLIGMAKLEDGRRELQVKEAKHGYWWLFGAGLLLGLGVVSRKSVLALGLAVLFGVLFGVKSWRDKFKSLLVIGAGFGLVLVIFLSVAWMVYGSEGFWEATGYNSAEDGLSAVDEAEIEQVRAYSIRGMTPFFRESLPLVLMSMLGLGFVGEWVISGLFRGRSWFSSRNGILLQIIEKISWIVPLLVFGWAWSFFREYEGSSIMVYGMWQLWWAMLLVIILFVVWPGRNNTYVEMRDKEKADDDRLGNKIALSESEEKSVNETVSLSKNIVSWIVPVVWTGGLVFFYMNWIKFHANYIGEFLPPLVILSGVAIPEMWRRVTVFSKRGKGFVESVSKVLLMLTLTSVLGWALFVSGYVTYMYEHTGTFQQSSLKEAAAWAKENIPMKEPIFTGAAAVPYLSGHHTVLDIAHPRWYAYEFTRKDTERLNTFLPSAEEMLEAYRNANWFLLEKQTGFSFLMEYSEIEAGLETDWERMHGIENGSNTLTFYKRSITKK